MEVYVVPSILGKKDDIGRWVGITSRDIQARGGPLHHLKLLTDTIRGFLLAEIRLFADSQSPTYAVVIRLKN